MTIIRGACVRKRTQTSAKRVSRVPGSRNGRETQNCCHFFKLRVENMSTVTEKGEERREDRGEKREERREKRQEREE